MILKHLIFRITNNNNRKQKKTYRHERGKKNINVCDMSAMVAPRMISYHRQTLVHKTRRQVKYHT